jgi:hypothetical protein
VAHFPEKNLDFLGGRRKMPWGKELEGQKYFRVIGWGAFRAS